ncbi:hypothetical protein [Morganella psychrotolerans]|uniref:hypothetical protein n=1 Tax=Morganella psychrotolerans TaxID=368603 RepID=UPI0039B0CC88
MRAMDGAPELTGMYLQRLFVLPVISPPPVLKLVLPDAKSASSFSHKLNDLADTFSPLFLNLNSFKLNAISAFYKCPCKRQITGRETKSMRAMDGTPELTGMYLQRLFVLPVISLSTEAEISTP